MDSESYYINWLPILLTDKRNGHNFRLYLFPVGFFFFLVPMDLPGALCSHACLQAANVLLPE